MGYIMGGPQWVILWGGANLYYVYQLYNSQNVEAVLLYLGSKLI